MPSLPFQILPQMANNSMKPLTKPLKDRSENTHWQSLDCREAMRPANICVLLLYISFPSNHLRSELQEDLNADGTRQEKSRGEKHATQLLHAHGYSEIARTLCLNQFLILTQSTPHFKQLDIHILISILPLALLPLLSSHAVQI